jgi:formylglycine-generating enzyme required for sulfatase activity
VVRGGAFVDYDGYLRCASRSRLEPDSRNGDIGFRVVLSPLL